MDLVRRAQESVVRCEGELSKLIAEAASVGAYEAAATIARLARSISEGAAVLTGCGEQRDGDSPDGPTRVVSPANPELGQGGRKQATPAIGQRDGRGAAGSDSRGVIDRYPSFLRDGDRLIKVGRSRGAGEKYEHRAGKIVLDLVASAAVKAADDRRRFEISGLGTLRLSKGQPPIPSYQVYLCLAWLKAVGLIQPLGRSTYRIVSKAEFLDELERQWQQTEQV